MLIAEESVTDIEKYTTGATPFPTTFPTHYDIFAKSRTNITTVIVFYPPK